MPFRMAFLLGLHGRHSHISLGSAALKLLGETFQRHRTLAERIEDQVRLKELSDILSQGR